MHSGAVCGIGKVDCVYRAAVAHIFELHGIEYASIGGGYVYADAFKHGVHVHYVCNRDVA